MSENIFGGQSHQALCLIAGDVLCDLRMLYRAFSYISSRKEPLMVRRELREHIFKVLFQIEFNEMSDMPEHLMLYFENLESASDKDKEYITKKFEAISGKAGEIDRILNEKTTGWKTTRMSKVDLTILRLAVFEMKWDDDVPTGVAINEAVELAKRFSGEEGPSFVNGVLAKLTD